MEYLPNPWYIIAWDVVGFIVVLRMLVLLVFGSLKKWAEKHARDDDLAKQSSTTNQVIIDRYQSENTALKRENVLLKADIHKASTENIDLKSQSAQSEQLKNASTIEQQRESIGLKDREAAIFQTKIRSAEKLTKEQAEEILKMHNTITKREAVLVSALQQMGPARGISQGTLTIVKDNGAAENVGVEAGEVL